MEHISKHLTIPKKELQQSESKPLKIGKDFALAINTRRINQSTNGEIEDVLKLVMLKVGIRANNLPAKEEKNILINHIRQNYQLANIGELFLAFEMALTGKLNLKPDEIKCYENFSCAYLSTIMNAYLFWAADQRKMAIDEPPPIKIYTEEEIKNLQREWTEEFYQQIKRGIVRNIPSYSREILKKDGIIKEEKDADDFFVNALNSNREKIYTNDCE